MFNNQRRSNNELYYIIIELLQIKQDGFVWFPRSPALWTYGPLPLTNYFRWNTFKSMAQKKVFFRRYKFFTLFQLIFGGKCEEKFSEIALKPQIQSTRQ